MRRLSVFAVLVVVIAVSGASFFGTGNVLAATPILLTEIVVTPTGAEFIEIYNPNAVAVDLSNIYLTDATYAAGGDYYYNIVTGTHIGGGTNSDFNARFPDGASIPSGAYQTVALNGSDNFFATFGVYPTYELYEDGGVADGIPDMREALPGSINGQGGLTNDGEVVILYYWDGQSDLVTDLDYVVWGDKAEAVDKTGVALDGPDAGSDPSSYQSDTAISSQSVVATGAHAIGNSWQRADLNEGAETQTGGNGVGGNDETSEDLNNTWCECTRTPNGPSSCPCGESGDIIIKKVTVFPDESNEFKFTMDIPDVTHPFNFTLKDGHQLAIAGVDAGTPYTITELDPAPQYVLTDVVCEDFIGSSWSWNRGTLTLHVTVAPGDTITCTFTNNILENSSNSLIPTLTSWGMMAAATILGLIAFLRIRRRRNV